MVADCKGKVTATLVELPGCGTFSDFQVKIKGDCAAKSRLKVWAQFQEAPSGRLSSPDEGEYTVPEKSGEFSVPFVSCRRGRAGFDFETLSP
ncbi:hypothetical protein UNPF46_12820 [Bradyrhizobium sp. UNPF46]|nr:hypothetical protein UNPF46_12820 [Bradyrhizobium sp. UNPF46]